MITPSPYPMVGKTFLHWQDALREAGWTEAMIAAEEARREPAPPRFWRTRTTRSARERTRLWGRSAANEVLHRARLAPLGKYFFEAIRREFVRPSWSGDMTLRVLWKYALASLCGGVKVSPFPQRSTSRYFGETIKWARNLVFGAVKRGELTREQGDAMRAVLDAHLDESLSEKMNPWRKLLTRKNGHLGASKKSGLGRATDVCAREYLYEEDKEKLLYTSDELLSDSDARKNFLKGEKTNKQTPPNLASELRPIPRFDGKLPRRLWGVVRTWRNDFRLCHWDDCKVTWSEKHWLSWFKSCLVAGKRAHDLLDLYYDSLVKWHGRGCDWLPTYESRLEPFGLFSELYRTASALPQSKYFKDYYRHETPEAARV